MKATIAGARGPILVGFGYLAAGFLLTIRTSPLAAQDNHPRPLPAAHAPTMMRLTLDDAKQRVLSNNKLLALATMNVQGKEYALRAVQANYFPQVIGQTIYFHFDDDLGKVLTTPGRTITGPRGNTIVGIPPITREAAVLNEDSSFSTLAAVQPITDLLKVRQGVLIAEADENIAHTQVEKAARELVSGVEQLYWGLLALQEIRAGALQSVKAAEMLASKLPVVEVKIALTESVQGLQQAEAQLADIQEKLVGLVDLPPCTQLELVEPNLPVLPYRCADEVVPLALSASPDVQEAAQNIAKARAATAAARVDWLPNVAVVGGGALQTGMDYVQQDFAYVGVIGSYTFFDWGKRRNTVHERENLIAMATLKLHQVEDEVRQKVIKGFRDVGQREAELREAQRMAELRKEAEKQATTPEAFRNPTPLLKATKDRALAEVDLVKADLAYREAFVKLMSLLGKQ